MLHAAFVVMLSLAVQPSAPTQAPAPAQAPTHPDFSGRWAIAASAAGPGARPGGAGRGDMGSGWGSPITVTQDATRLTIEYAFFARGDMQPPLKFVYALDGSETRNAVMLGRGTQTQVSRTAWEDAKLVITTIHTLADPATGKPVTETVTQTLTLDTPSTLVVETVRAGVLGAAATSTKVTYQKN
jgi:hypothetical protein